MATEQINAGTRVASYLHNFLSALFLFRAFHCFQCSFIADANLLWLNILQLTVNCFLVFSWIFTTKNWNTNYKYSWHPYDDICKLFVRWTRSEAFFVKYKIKALFGPLCVLQSVRDLVQATSNFANFHDIPRRFFLTFFSIYEFRETQPSDFLTLLKGVINEWFSIYIDLLGWHSV